MEFCKSFNARTQDKQGLIIPAVITVYSDRSFTFELRTPPAAVLLKRAAKIAKGSGAPNRDKVAKVTRKQLIDIAELKAPDLNSHDTDAPAASIAGTPRPTGIEVGGSSGRRTSTSRPP